MQYQKLTTDQRSIKRWRERRNALVCKLLNENPRLTRADALELANAEMRQRDEKKRKALVAKTG